MEGQRHSLALILVPPELLLTPGAQKGPGGATQYLLSESPLPEASRPFSENISVLSWGIFSRFLEELFHLRHIKYQADKYILGTTEEMKIF